VARQLPAHLADWDAVMLPLAADAPGHASNARKVLECLTAGKPIVATPVPDVMDPCGRLGLVRLAEDAPHFAAALSAELAGEHVASASERDAFLARTSWDTTFRHMYDLLSKALARRAALQAVSRARRGVQPAQH
jgi:UDP-galactopyranose mutase